MGAIPQLFLMEWFVICCMAVMVLLVVGCWFLKNMEFLIMRDLLLLRGVQASGKSTFISENGLEPYTLCPDVIRLMFRSPVFDVHTGERSISGACDKGVWKMVFDLAEQRMERGEFIVIDATNVDVSKWLELSKRYGYRVWGKQFDVLLEDALFRNAKRLEYKRVPEHAIRRTHEKILARSFPSSVRLIDTMADMTVVPFIADKYSRVEVFGDIHGCYEPLKSWFSAHPMSDDCLYVFVGDYLDRGIQNAEVLAFLVGLRRCKNVIFLEGNHNWERHFFRGDTDKIRSDEFLVRTAYQIRDFKREDALEWIDGWREQFLFEFGGRRYFVTHAGMGFKPSDKDMRFVPAIDMIRGGSYDDDVDAWYCEGCDGEYVQIHGHRNKKGYSAMAFQNSVNLNSAVEYGEPLRVAVINGEGVRVKEVDNPVFSDRENPWKSRGAK